MLGLDRGTDRLREHVVEPLPVCRRPLARHSVLERQRGRRCLRHHDPDAAGLLGLANGAQSLCRQVRPDQRDLPVHKARPAPKDLSDPRAPKARRVTRARPAPRARRAPRAHQGRSVRKARPVPPGSRERLVPKVPPASKDPRARRVTPEPWARLDPRAPLASQRHPPHLRRLQPEPWNNRQQ